jgi:hypothetical protein
MVGALVAGTTAVAGRRLLGVGDEMVAAGDWAEFERLLVRIANQMAVRATIEKKMRNLIGSSKTPPLS